MKIFRNWRATALAVTLLSIAVCSLQATTAAVAQSATPSAAAATPSPASPLTADQIKADREVWKKADCANCHGWSGNGQDTGPVPPGPSLRGLQLDYDTVHQVVQCGVPSSRMPSHDRLAYVDDRCYGQTSAQMGKTKPQKGIALRPEEIDAIAAYVAGYLEGKPQTTKAECEEYFGAGNAGCDEYK